MQENGIGDQDIMKSDMPLTTGTLKTLQLIGFS